MILIYTCIEIFSMMECTPLSPLCTRMTTYCNHNIIKSLFTLQATDRQLLWVNKLNVNLLLLLTL